MDDNSAPAGSSDHASATAGSGSGSGIGTAAASRVPVCGAMPTRVTGSGTRAANRAAPIAATVWASAVVVTAVRNACESCWVT